MFKCALCREESDLELSHIIPKFVFRKIKKNSPTGYMRIYNNPDLRVQDGDKLELLCGSCEDRFSIAETDFANTIFHPYQDNNIQDFIYDSWMNYFITSVNWRTLYLDLIGFVKDGNIEIEYLEILIDAEKTMREFLLGRRSDLSYIENHIFFFDEINDTTEKIKELRPQSFIRSSAFGYTFIAKDYKSVYVYANLAGILIITIIKKCEIEEWRNTIVKMGRGEIKQPVYIKSPLPDDLFKLIEEVNAAKMSLEQQEKLKKQIQENSGKLIKSKYAQFVQMDLRLLDGE